MILCPLWPAFFSKFPIILWNIVWFDFPLAIFSPQYIVCERTIIAWPKREKIKTQGEKISYIFPQLKYSAQILSQKKIVFSGKNMIWFPSCNIFSPQYTVCESRKIIAWPKGEKIKTLGEKISYIFPQLDFCALLV